MSTAAASPSSMTPAAPAAPSAPAIPTTVPAVPAPAAVPAKGASTPLDDAFSDLAEMADVDAATLEPAVKPPEVKAPDPKAATPAKPAEVKPPAAPKPGEPPATPAEPADGPKPPAQLRKAYEELKAKHNALQTEHERMKTAKPQPDPEVMTRLEKAEKRRQELEDEMKFVSYERSSEFKEKYQEPFIEAFQAGRQKIESLDVVQKSILVDDGTGTGEKTEKILRQARPATAADFDQLMSIPNDREARKFAKEMFGEDAAIAMQHREKCVELNSAQHRALEDFKKNGAEREKLQLETRSRKDRESAALFTKLNEAAAEKYPSWFKPSGDDAEGNPIDKRGDELLAKGFELVDRAFSAEASKIPAEELIKLHSSIRNRAAAFGRLTHQNKQLQTQLEELKKQLEAFNNADPGAADGQRKAAGEDKEFGEAALDRYAQPA